MRVAILGCGPAGLMAAHAVVESGEEPHIYSRKIKSPLYGAQYLHAPIPGITDRDAHVGVDYLLRGSVEDYRSKVYGKQWDGNVSPEDLSDPHQAWDIRETYDRLWELYSGLIHDSEVQPRSIRALLDGNPDLLINSIPLAALCHQGHTFQAQEIIAAGDAPKLGINVGRMFQCPPNTVICNGEDSPSWYRISNIFDHTTVEWPGGMRVPVSTAATLPKPTKHNCDCWPEVFNVGRFGSWTKGVLSHSAYFKTLERIENGASAEATPELP